MAKQLQTCLWFENQAKEAADFYCGIFPNSKILSVSPMAVHFELNGTPFMALNGKKPEMQFNDSVSFVISCENQAEIDHYWEAFTRNGGREKMCGWCSDKFGVSWQVIPSVLGALLNDPVKSKSVMVALLKMKKVRLDELV